MGSVYKCHDEQLDRYVAVKVLSERWASSEEFLERFRREAKLLAAINHPGIAHVYTFAEEDGKSFFALQWCSGGSLANRIKQEKKIGLMQGIDIVLQCARALVAASLKGVVHRDIKPSNIMFDENQQVKLVDFGVAHVESVSAQLTVAREIIGSPAYMAPEQAKAMQVDHRADIYALGITFYHMLYGRLPFRAKSPIEWVLKHATEPFPPYEDHGEGIPPKAYDIIRSMTQKDPMDRYQTYADLIGDLEKLRKELFSRSELRIPRARDISTAPDFRQENYFELLSELNRRHATGVLKVSWGPLQKKFLIDHSDVIFYESPQPDENFWTAMVQRGLMKQEDVPSAGQDLEESLNHLLFIQAFSPEDFNIIYREMTYSSILQVFLWPLMQGEFYSARIEHDAFCRIPLSRVVFEGARTMIPDEVILSRIPRDQFILATPIFGSVLGALNLPRAENFLASRLEGERCTLNMLQLLTGFPLEQIVRFVYALKGLGAVEYRNQSDFRPRRKLDDTFPGVQSPPSHPLQQERNDPITPSPRETPVQTPPPDEKFETPSSPKSGATDPAELSFRLAVQKYEKGEYMEAERLCARAIKDHPHDGKYHRLRGMALSHSPEFLKNAEEAFRTAIRLDPANPDYHVDLALFLRNRGDMMPAILECERALEISPRHKKARKLLRELEG
jgi:serine/threonine protein kinase